MIFVRVVMISVRVASLVPMLAECIQWIHFTLLLHTYLSTPSKQTEDFQMSMTPYEAQLTQLSLLIMMQMWSSVTWAHHQLKVTATTTQIDQFIRSKLQIYSYLNGYYSGRRNIRHINNTHTIFSFMHSLRQFHFCIRLQFSIWYNHWTAQMHSTFTKGTFTA